VYLIFGVFCFFFIINQINFGRNDKAKPDFKFCSKETTAELGEEQPPQDLAV